MNDKNDFKKSIVLAAEITHLWRWLEVYFLDLSRSLIQDLSHGGEVTYRRLFQKIPSEHEFVFTYALEDYSPNAAAKELRLDNYPEPTCFVQLVELNPGRTEIIFSIERFSNRPSVAFWESDLKKIESELLKRFSVTGVIQVSDHKNRNEDILKRWNELWTYKEIGDEFGLSEGRVANIITDLRKERGEERVPFHR